MTRLSVGSACGLGYSQATFTDELVCAGPVEVAGMKLVHVNPTLIKPLWGELCSQRRFHYKQPNYLRY